MNDDVIEHEITDSPEKRVVASLPRESVRSLFHLLAGKPDSVQKTYAREIIVSVESIVDLHERILDKLRNHHIDGLTASVDVTYENDTTVQFGSWSEFTGHRWTGPESTKEVIAKWDFLVAMPEFEMPQRHTLSVKITGDPKPFEMLRSVLSTDVDDLENIEFKLVPVIARVDFINHILSKELISIVDDWNEALPQPDKNGAIYKFINKHSDKLTSFIRNLLPLLSFIVAYISLEWFFPTEDAANAVSIDTLKSALTWVLLASGALLFIVRLSSWLSYVTDSAISKYGRFSIFNLTNGDNNAQSKFNGKNRKQALKFIGSSSLSLLLNIAAGIVVVKYFSG